MILLLHPSLPCRNACPPRPSAALTSGAMGMSEYAAAMGSLSGLAGSLGAFPMAGVSGHIAEMQGLGQHPVSMRFPGNLRRAEPLML